MFRFFFQQFFNVRESAQVIQLIHNPDLFVSKSLNETDHCELYRDKTPGDHG